jgi:hypothetical protein
MLLIDRPINEIPVWLNAGNFRPLGRFFEGLGYLIPMMMASLTNLTPEFWYSIVRLLLWIVFHFCIFYFCKRLFSNYPVQGDTSGLLCVVISNSISLINSQSGGLRLFPSFYTTSGIVVILSLSFILTNIKLEHKNLKSIFVKIIIGMVAASYNELTNVIIPVSFIVIYFSLPYKNKFEKLRKSVLNFAYIGIPFLIIWFPTRIYIYRYCAANQCYEASNVSYNELYVGTFFKRITSSVPPLPYLTSKNWLDRYEIPLYLKIFSATLFVLTLVILFNLVKILLRIECVPKNNELNQLLIVGASTIIITGSIVSFSGELQKQYLFGVSWRETPLYIFSLSLLIVFFITIILKYSNLRSLNKMIVAMIFVLFFSFMISMTSIANFGLTSQYRLEPVAKLSKKIESQLVSTRENKVHIKQICLQITNKNLFPENVSLALEQGINLFYTYKKGKELCSSSPE